ncbi:hypothetical protein VP01_3267g2 [Puccinia sorghi]|uniref:Uncharacterized protein n=1 Tax=Puccinia sorghi TaxID=27349 RepID=A0A0L6UZU1_9BASI|nr:hypothetical protein VP01_3267g2 [Puccinia sorghi]
MNTRPNNTVLPSTPEVPESKPLEAGLQVAANKSKDCEQPPGVRSAKQKVNKDEYWQKKTEVAGILS